MKRLSLFSLLVFGLILTGCQSATYRWVGTDAGFPPEHVKYVDAKNMSIIYALKQDSSEGKYHFEGKAKNKGRHTKGRIDSGSFYLHLFKEGNEVAKIRLNKQGSDMGRPILLNRDFECAEEFDCTSISWNVKYRY